MSLVLVGVWLAAVGVADLGRAGFRAPGRGRASACAAAGTLALLAGLLVVDLAWPARALLGLVLTALLAGWVLLPARGAVLCLVAGGVTGLLSAGAVRAERSWPPWLAETVLGSFGVSAVLVALGVVLSQLSTANLVVRLLLDAVGVPATTNEKQLRGGRVLGPMERVLLVCLGAAGELTATAIVVAAKGILRFPELQRAHRDAAPAPDGPSDVTEYFLIGSLASWLLALAGAALLRIAAA